MATENEKLFASIKQHRVLIAGFAGSEGVHIKKSFYAKGIKNIDDIRNGIQAYEKTELLQYNLVIINIDTPPNDEALSHFVASHRFEETPFFVYSKTPDIYKKIYSKRKVITVFFEMPLNLGEIEGKMLPLIKAKLLKKSLIGHTNLTLKEYSLGCKAFKEGKLDEAMEHLKQCIKSNNSFMDGYLKLAEVLIAKEDYDIAMKVLKMAVREDPSDGRTCVMVGELMTKKNDKNNAMNAFRMAVKTEPDNVQILTDIGNICLEMGWVDESLEFFGTAKKQNPDFFYIYNRMGIALSRAERYEEAEEEYSKAVEIEPEDPGIYYNLGMLWNRRKDDQKAITFFRKSLEKDPEFEEASKMIEKIKTGQSES